MYQRRTSFAKQSGEGESKTTQAGRISYGHSSCKGHRPTMEDEVCTKLDCPGLPGSGFFGVFDGHGGPSMSKYAAQVIPARIFSRLRNVNQVGNGACPQTRLGMMDPLSLPQIKSLHDRYTRNVGASNLSSISVSSWPPRPVDSTHGHFKSILRNVFMETDLMSLKAANSKECGTTACCVLITEDYYVFANLGDSRAMLVSGDRVVFATKDHKPQDICERDRIYGAGGFVLRGRVCGSLAVARALGDHTFKSSTLPQVSQMVSCEPDIHYVDRNVIRDEFIVLACDGLYDVMTNAAVASFVRESLRHFNSIAVVASHLVDQALQRGSTDNISVIIITFVDGSVRHHAEHSGKHKRFSKPNMRARKSLPKPPPFLPPLVNSSAAPSKDGLRFGMGLPSPKIVETDDDVYSDSDSDSDSHSDSEERRRQSVHLS